MKKSRLHHEKSVPPLGNRAKRRQRMEFDWNLLLFLFFLKGIFPFCVAVEILQHKAEKRGDSRGFDQVDVVGFGKEIADVRYDQILYYNGKL